jgi:hypothetical protein
MRKSRPVSFSMKAGPTSPVSEMLSGTLTFGRIATPASRGERSGGTSDVRKAVTGASIGNAVEWFDFAIYGFLATFIAANFFPSGNETAALLNTFAIFAAAFFMRPLGGFVFGPWATGSRGNGCWPSSSC